MSTDKHSYIVNLEWEGGRIGTLSSDKLGMDIQVATPPEFPGGIEGIWSPEHLFVASISSCFMTTFVAIAENSNLEYESLDVKAEGIMTRKEGKFAITEIILKPVLVIPDNDKAEKAERILEKAESACLISRSVTTDIKLEPKVKIAALD